MTRALSPFCAASRSGVVALLVTAMTASPVSAEEPATTSVVVVEVDASIERAEQLRTRIAADADAVLKENDVATTVDPKAPRTLTIDVGGQRYAYEIELVVERAGKADEPLRLTCECNYDELFAKVQAGVRDSVPALQRAVTTTEPKIDPPKPNGETTTPPREPDRGNAPLGPLGKGGIATLVVGVAGLATGIALVVVGKRNAAENDDGLEGDQSGTDLRPTGYALLAVGGAALVTGAVLLGIDRSRARKRRTVAAPWFGPRSAGISFVTRF